MRKEDPMEEMVGRALAAAGVRFTTPAETRPAPGSSHTLDFHLLDYDLYIEVKQFHSDRIAEQMSRAPNVIAIQGRAAAEWFCRAINGEKNERG